MLKCPLGWVSWPLFFLCVGLSGSSQEDASTIQSGAWGVARENGNTTYVGLYSVYNEEWDNEVIKFADCSDTVKMCSECEDVYEPVLALLVLAFICSVVGVGVQTMRITTENENLIVGAVAAYLLAFSFGVAGVASFSPCSDAAEDTYPNYEGGVGFSLSLCASVITLMSGAFSIADWEECMRPKDMIPIDQVEMVENNSA